AASPLYMYTLSLHDALPIWNGLYKVATPFTLGQEAAGVVSAVGAGVTDPKVGDRVVYASILGAYAEYAVVPADRVVVLPEGVTRSEEHTSELQSPDQLVSRL